MQIYLIRHGQTDWNIEGRFQGHEDIPLNAQGVEQARACGEALKSVRFSSIQTSPLVRAKATAEWIARYQRCKVTENRALIERHFGQLSGLTREQREAFIATGQPDGVEPRESVVKRALKVMDDLEQVYSHEAVAVVTHGAWINSFLSAITNGQIGSGKTLLKNACINHLKKDGPNWEILIYNVTAEEFAALE